VKINLCKKGDVINIDKYTYLEALYPWKDSPENTSLNNSSIVLKLHYKNTSILFPGDIEKDAEDALIDAKSDLSADVLKVSHHGSISSTGKKFLEMVKPKTAVISVGKNNFGHPSMEVLKRFSDSNVLLFRTDECGAVVLNTDGKSIKIKRTVKN
jgi:competence protein ComEC